LPWVWFSFPFLPKKMEKHVPMVELSHNLMRKVDVWHLWLEEVLRGNASVNFQADVLDNLKQGLALTHAVLFQDHQKMGGIEVIGQDHKGNALLTNLYYQMRLFQELATARWKQAGQSMESTEVSKAYSGVYSEIRKKGVEIQEVVDLLILGEHKRIHQVNRWIAGLFITLLIGISLVVRRDRGFMREKNSELEKRAGELSEKTDELKMKTLEVTKENRERKKAEREIKKFNDLLVAISQAQSEFISERDTHDLFDAMLNRVLALTQSEYGFIGEVLFKSDGRPYLKTRALTNISWNDETRKFYDQNIPEGLEFHNLKTLFGVVLSSGEPVISNSPETDSRRGGLPEGHPPLNAFLGIPLFLGSKMVGMMGIANRRGSYDEGLVEFLRPLLNTCANIIEANRNALKRKEAEKALQTSETRFSGILDIANEGIISIDENQNIIIFNKGAEGIFGYSEEEILGRSLDVLIPEKFRSHHGGHLSKFSETEGRSRLMGERREIFGLRKNGEEFPAEASISKLNTGKERIFTVVLRDISERKKAEMALSEQVIRDSLTNLYNRRYFNHCLEKEMIQTVQKNQSFSVLMCDLDGFKKINDSKGHQAGDEIIKKVSLSIKNSVRGIDHVFRWGGDEFVVLLSGTDRKGVLLTSERIRKGIQDLSGGLAKKWK